MKSRGIMTNISNTNGGSFNRPVVQKPVEKKSAQTVGTGQSQPVKDTFVASQSRVVDLDALPQKFVQVESEYTKTHGKAVTDSSSQVSSYDFLKNHLQPYDILDSKYRTGKEADLMKQVQAQIKQNEGTGKKIEPEDLYKMALELNDGDRFKALVTVQDALKMTGRAEQVGTNSAREMKELVGEEFFNNYVQKNGGTYKPDMANKMGEAFMQKNFKPIGSFSDFTGRYYHMFGTAAGSASGPLGNIATVAHAAQINFKGNLDQNHKTLGQDYWNGVPVMEQFSKYVVTPVISMFAGGHFYGEYTTVGHHKWDADKTGMAISRELKASDSAYQEPWT